jgi:hypothetical protein
VTAILVLAAVLFAAAAAWVIFGVLQDKAGEAEWAQVERLWQASGRSVVTALRRDIYRRSGLR